MVEYILVILSMIKEKVKVKLYGLMEEFMKELSKMENNMAMVLSLGLIKSREKVSGKKVDVFVGLLMIKRKNDFLYFICVFIF